jgi:hypothetical protein
VGKAWKRKQKDTKGKEVLLLSRIEEARRLQLYTVYCETTLSGSGGGWPGDAK